MPARSGGKELPRHSLCIAALMAQSKNVSDYVIERLSAWGIERIYGYSGDGINGLLGALGRAGNKPCLIQPPHEELCALMATAHAKYTGKVGVCP